MFLPGFSILGSSGPIESEKGVIREKSGSKCLDKVNPTDWVFSKDTIAN